MINSCYEFLMCFLFILLLFLVVQDTHLSEQNAALQGETPLEPLFFAKNKHKKEQGVRNLYIRFKNVRTFFMFV